MNFLRFLLPSVLFSTILLADPMLSSKAVRNAMRAKEIVYSHDNAHLPHATECLESILCDPSFRRLDSHTQVEIILVLSQAYDQLKRYQNQEMVLLLHAKRPELFRHQILLKTTLAHSFVEQGRIEDAENLLSSIIQSSCAHYSLEEKSEIAHVLSFKDDYLNRLLLQSDSLIKAEKWKEAIQKLTTVLSSINRHQFPYQSSAVEKRRLRQKILWQIANIHFCLSNYKECIHTLSEFEEELSSSKFDREISSRRLFLLALSYEGLQCHEESTVYFQKYLATPLTKSQPLSHEAECLVTSTQDNEISHSSSPPYLLWKAHRAIQSQNPVLLQQCIEKMAPGSYGLRHILSGFCASCEHKLLDAHRELLLGLSCTPDSNWKDAACQLLAETTFERALLLLLTDQKKAAQAVIEETKNALSLSKNPTVLIRKAYFEYILFSITKDPSHLEKARMIDEEGIASRNIILEAILQQKRPESFANLSLNDVIFLEWALDGVVSLKHVEDPKSGIGKFLKATSLFQQAIAEEISIEEASSYLVDCTSDPNLQDIRPHLLCFLAELSLHEERLAEGYEYVHEAMQEYPNHPRLYHTILSCIFAFESSPNLQTEYEILCQHLFSVPSLSDTLLLCMHYFETKKQLIDHDPTLKAFGQALMLREECNGRLAEASSSKEPAVVKESIENAEKAALQSRSNALEVISSLHDPASLCIVWGFILGLHEKMIESLEHCISSEYAFIELPSLIETERQNLQHDLETISETVPEWNHFLSRAYFENCLALKTSVSLYVATFNHDTTLALQTLQNTNLSQLYSSVCGVRASVFLAKTLREYSFPDKAYALLTTFDEKSLQESNYELALEIAMEKSLCLRELKKIDQAMNILAWVINGPYASSLRVKAMILRADLYLAQHRTDLAIRQLESVVAKGGEWGAVAERKLRELYGNN
jgi:predicted negative regulator of RcsB-dependent stress response